MQGSLMLRHRLTLPEATRSRAPIVSSFRALPRRVRASQAVACGLRPFSAVVKLRSHLFEGVSNLCRL
eukprot:1909570-Alexandrium_andersonii.AAC.1